MGRYIDAAISHLKKLSSQGRANYCDQPTAMWMASIDTKSRRYPANDTRPNHIPKRVYRRIDAPRGCTLYWDQPQLIASHMLSGVTGDKRYSKAADSYVRDFLRKCVSKEGIFLWGNHYYYDAFADCVQFFKGSEDPRPFQVDKDQPDYHETRPIPPAYELFWRVDEKATRRHVERVSARHFYDMNSGGFSTHSDFKREFAFTEAGGTLVESMCWLAGQLDREDIASNALMAAEYSYSFVDPETGLMPISPLTERWDKTTATTEVGLWAGCLVRAARRLGDHWISDRLIDLAGMAMSAYVKYAWDEQELRLYGQLNIQTGKPTLEEDPKRMPERYANLWDAQFPRHNYPLQFAEACLLLSLFEGGHEFPAMIDNLAEMVARQIPEREEAGAYAEHYGRAMHLLLKASDVLEDDSYKDAAQEMADQAMTHLYDYGMFRSHPGENRYDAVDGVGYLLLSLLYLETGQDPPMMGSGW